MSKSKASQKFIYKIHSGRLRSSKWNLTLPLDEARRNDEVISLADSQIFRWIDEINNVSGVEERVRDIRRKIREIRNQPNSAENRREIRKLYAQLDDIQFHPDYLSLIIDRVSDYRRACKGFKINGITYKRLLGTNGGIKTSTIVFVSERVHEELNRRIENNRNVDIPLVTAKLEAYKALTCSASIPVSLPKGILVVTDCVTRFRDDVVYLSDENCGEPEMRYAQNEEIELEESDGYGLMSPSLARRWSEELGLNYIVSGVNTRFSWEKGMVFTFDFHDFADKVAGEYIVEDAWGNTVDVRDVELILTTSMLKLWDSYESCDEYLRCCAENHYTFGVTKTCPGVLENQHSLNYQFIQPFPLDDDDIDELIAPTIQELKDVINGNAYKSILFMKGVGLNENNVDAGPADCVRGMMVEPKLLNDKYVQTKIFYAIKKRINRAKVGVINVHGNYSIVSGDPYSLCQHIFGLEVTGLLKAGEIYNKYWADINADELICFRAPMSCFENIRKVKSRYDEETSYWYRYMTTCTLFNSWDTCAHALNGMDKDGDLVMLTDNPVLLRRHVKLPTLMCMQRKAEKKISTEEDFVNSNIDSFGDDIGKTTNWITSMYDVRSRFSEDSKEYKELTYRIMCGQHYQQNAIDKAKGIICKPMPREWHDRHALNQISDQETRDFYQRIIADKKPYFMRLIYSDLMKEYNKYIKDTTKHSIRNFKISVDELKLIPEEDLTDEQVNFLKYYDYGMPVSLGDCVMNKICRRFEHEFDNYLKSTPKPEEAFDYSILKNDLEYSPGMVTSINKLYNAYNKKLKDYVIFSNIERISDDDASVHLDNLMDEFIKECSKVCSDRMVLSNVILDVCYKKSNTKGFAWGICGEEIIETLLSKNNYEYVYPEYDPNGEIEYAGMKFSLSKKTVIPHDDKQGE